MPLPISDDHKALAEVARSFLQRHDSLGAARSTLDRADDANAPFWSELAGLGWTGLHVPEALGGQGYGLEELCVVQEELGRVVAPIPFLPSVLAAAVLANNGTPTERSPRTSRPSARERRSAPSDLAAA